jgi:hypothetical protein
MLQYTVMVLVQLQSSIVAVGLNKQIQVFKKKNSF